ncbi:MAG: TPM domain-containing protein, partial [Cyanobacteria bacterium P01_C01_bin.72]
FIAFGMGPVVIRTPDFLPLFRNIIGFALGAVVAFISPTFLENPTSDSEV